MVGDGDGLVPPGGGLGDHLTHVGEGVHAGHAGMEMELHPLFRRGVLSLGLLSQHDAQGLHDHLVFIPVKGHLALNGNPHAGLDALKNGLGLVRLHELVDPHGASVVGDVKGDDPGIALFELPVVDGEDLALHHHLVHVELQLRHGRGLSIEGTAENQVGIAGFRGLGRWCRTAGRRNRHLGQCADGLLADARRLGIEGIPGKGAVAGDGDLRRRAEGILEMAAELREVGLQLLLAVGHQVYGHGLGGHLPAAAGQNGAGRRVDAAKEIYKVPVVSLGQRRLREGTAEGKPLQAVGGLNVVPQGFELCAGEVGRGKQAHLHPPRLGVNVGAQDFGLLKDGTPVLGKRAGGKEIH